MGNELLNDLPPRAQEQVLEALLNKLPPDVRAAALEVAHWLATERCDQEPVSPAEVELWIESVRVKNERRFQQRGATVLPFRRMP